MRQAGREMLRPLRATNAESCASFALRMPGGDVPMTCETSRCAGERRVVLKQTLPVGLSLHGGNRSAASSKDGNARGGCIDLS